MDRSLKPGIAVKTKIKFSAKRLAAGFVGLVWLFSILSCNLPALSLGDPGNSLPTLEPTATVYVPAMQSTAYFVSTQTDKPPTPAPTRTNAPPVMYYAQSGD